MLNGGYCDEDIRRGSIDNSPSAVNITELGRGERREGREGRGGRV